MLPASTAFVLGYHGCDRSTAETVLAGEQTLKHSRNDYDWLGDGIYFWEHNAARAMQFARAVAKRPHNERQTIKLTCIRGYFRPLDARGRPLKW